MAGIVSYGAYIPLWRLPRDLIGKGLRGEKAVANFDEDSVTMAVAATMDCLKGFDRDKVDGLFFASTTSPYKEKQASAIIAAACDLPRNIITADFANSLKAGTAALQAALSMVKAGTARQVIVAAADCRLGEPGSEFEQTLGDGAAALLVGNTNVAADLEGSYSVSDEIMDLWRADGDTYIRSWEARFAVTEGYQKVTREVISGFLGKYKLPPQNIAKLAIYSPEPRRGVEVAAGLGFDAKTQLQDELFDFAGNTGTPYSLMLLVAALEQAKPDDLILVVSYGDGGDAMGFRVTEEIDKVQDVASRRGVAKHLETKRGIPDYRTYLLWRGILIRDMQPYPIPFGTLSAPALWRERNEVLRLHGVRCKVCGTVQYPPQRVCAKCHTKDQFEKVRLSDKRGMVFSYSVDNVDSQIDKPIVVPIIDFEGGGRMLCYMTDRVPEEIQVGMEVEMSFRKLFFREAVHNYFWKAIPIRTS